MSLHRPQKAAQLRGEEGEEFEAHIRARDAFWVRAAREGAQPLPSVPTSGAEPKAWPQGLQKLAGTRLDPPPSDRFRAHGAGPGRWPEEVRGWPEWGVWLRARDRIVVGHLALCHALTARKLTPEERDQKAADFEEVWQMARERFVGRAVEVYDPAYVSPKTGKTTKFSTTAGWWILNAVKTWRKDRRKAARFESLVETDPTEDADDRAASGARAVVTDPAAFLDPPTDDEAGNAEVRAAIIADLSRPSVVVRRRR